MVSFYSCLLGVFIGGCQPQIDDSAFLQLLIHPSVQNLDNPAAHAVVEVWQRYLQSNTHYLPESPYWFSARSAIPDAFLWALKLNDLEKPMQNIVLGVYPIDTTHYGLKTMFSSKDEKTGQTMIQYMITIYAKRVDGDYKLINSTDYHRNYWSREEIGPITYYIHPEHSFNHEQAYRMDSFNRALASHFEVPPLAFDYFVCNSARDIIELIGFDFRPRQFQQLQSGGMAANFDTIIYAGNNSAYYPHEVVHLYTYAKFRNKYHPWIDEGVATLFGGSAGYPLEWHLRKLADFLDENQDFVIEDLAALSKDIPNGEHTTDFRYVIGGLICKLIFDREGMNGLFEALESGKSDAEFFELMEKFFRIQKPQFGHFVRKEVGVYRD